MSKETIVNLLRLVGFCLLTAMVTTSHAQSKSSIETTYFSQDAYFAFVLRPAMMTERLEGKSDETKRSLETFFREEFELDVHDIDQVTWLVGKAATVDGNDDVENRFQLILRFKQNIEIEAFAEQFLASQTGVVLDEGNGVVYWSAGVSSPSCFFPDRKTAVVANRERLAKVIDSPITMNMVINRINSLPRDYEAVVIANTEGEINLFVEDLLPAGKLLSLDVLTLWEEMRWVTATVDFFDDEPIEMLFEMRSDELAEKLGKQIETLLSESKLQMPSLFQLSESSGEPRLKQILSDGLETLQAGLNGAVVTVDQQEVKLSISIKGGLLKAAPTLVLAMGGESEMYAEPDVILEDAVEEAVEDDIEDGFDRFEAPFEREVEIKKR